MTAPPAKETLESLVRGQTLSVEAARGFFEQLLQGLLEPAQIAAALALLASRSPTSDEITGAASAMRAHVTPVPIDSSEFARRGVAVLDTCGTGGAAKTFNVSTLAALVAAAAAPGKLALAKHGNRSRTGRGSAEVLKGLGVHVDASPQTQARCLREAGVCFCFAIHHHPAMRHAGPVRQSLGFPTIFNVLGPLTNPAGAECQLLGVYEESLRPKVAGALASLRCRSAWVMRSEDGLDEISINAPTRVTRVAREAAGPVLSELVVEPAALGIRPAPMDALVAADIGDAVRIARALLSGEAGPRRDMLVLNAGAALVVGGAAETLERGMALADAALSSGAALRTLDALVRVSNETQQ
jgi:anthranilate phosphoribosyltransferase